MKKDYHSILGVSKEADQKEIKRAYFKLVRLYSPEKDPERFQEIRKAYEILSEQNSERKAENKFTLSFPDTLLAEQMKTQIEKQMQAADYRGAAATAEEGLRLFGEWEGFYFFLAIAQCRVGNTGKAIKNLERLTVLCPDNPEHRRQLALAYWERGWGKKAYHAFQEAYDIGCRDVEFLNFFAMCCHDRKEDWQGIRLLLEAIGKLEKNLGQDMGNLLDMYGGVFLIGMNLPEKEYHEIVKKFSVFLQDFASELVEYEMEVTGILECGVCRCQLFGKDLPMIRELMEKARCIIPVGKEKRKNEYENRWERMEQEIERLGLEADRRLPEWLCSGADIFGLPEIYPSLYKYVLRDIQLCILEEWPGIREQLQAVRESYPLYYEMFQDFVKLLERTTDVDRLRNQLLKDYDRRDRDFDGGYYYEKYPERRKNQAVVHWSSDYDGTYTRSQPKVGRNAPCPCGSGKKYKNCCGR